MPLDSLNNEKYGIKNISRRRSSSSIFLILEFIDRQEISMHNRNSHLKKSESYAEKRSGVRIYITLKYGCLIFFIFFLHV